MSGRRHHARRPRAAAQAHGRRRARRAPHARRRSSPSARRCWPAASRSWRRRSRSSTVRAHQSGRRRAAPGRALRPARPHGRARHPRCDGRALRRALPHRPRARARVAAHGAGALSRRAPRAATRTSAQQRRVGGAAARDRLHGLALGLPQARRATSWRTPTCPASRAQEQQRLALLVLGCRGGLDEDGAGARRRRPARAQLLALRLAVLFHHARGQIAKPHVAWPSTARSSFGVSRTLAQGAPAVASYLLDHERDSGARSAIRGKRRGDGARSNRRDAGQDSAHRERLHHAGGDTAWSLARSETQRGIAARVDLEPRF